MANIKSYNAKLIGMGELHPQLLNFKVYKYIFGQTMVGLQDNYRFSIIKKSLLWLIVLFCLVTCAKAQYTYKILLQFNGVTSPMGSNPHGNLLLVGNRFYGMTLTGGIHNDGCIFSIDSTGGSYKDLYDFSIQYAGPYGSLIYNAGLLYGMTQDYVFSIDTNGSRFKNILNVCGQPEGSLTLSNGRLFGMTYDNSAACAGYPGSVFSVDTNGTGAKLSLHMFQYFGSPDGANPSGYVTIIGSKLYGMTQVGMNVYYPYGIIFTMDTNGNNYNIIHTFDGMTGNNAHGSLLYDGGHTLYGMTTGGRTSYNNDYFGNIFSIDTNGNSYKDLHEFAPDLMGGSPYGSLIMEGGVLFGLTSGNTLFSIDTDGSNFRNLFRFNDSTTGYSPYGDLTFDNCKFYGMTEFGSKISDSGVIFSFSALYANATVVANVSNLANNNGKAVVTAYGVGPYTYSWSPSGGTDSIASGLSAGTYTITVTNGNGCSSTTSVTIQNTTGTENLRGYNDAVNIYPNPSSGTFKFHFKSSVVSRQLTVDVYNALGEKVYSSPCAPSKGGQCSIDLNGQPEGIYFYKVTDDKGDVAGEGKFIIQK